MRQPLSTNLFTKCGEDHLRQIAGTGRDAQRASNGILYSYLKQIGLIIPRR